MLGLSQSRSWGVGGIQWRPGNVTPMCTSPRSHALREPKLRPTRIHFSKQVVDDEGRLERETVTVPVDGYQTVLKLKEAIGGMLDPPVPPDRVRLGLSHGAGMLADGHTLLEAGVKHDETLTVHVVRRLAMPTGPPPNSLLLRKGDRSELLRGISLEMDVKRLRALVRDALGCKPSDPEPCIYGVAKELDPTANQRVVHTQSMSRSDGHNRSSKSVCLGLTSGCLLASTRSTFSHPLLYSKFDKAMPKLLYRSSAIARNAVWSFWKFRLM